MARKVFSDGDGVLANFDKGFTDRFGCEMKGLKVEVWQQMIADTNGAFFDELPLMPDAMTYWEAILPYKPAILTGAPRIGYELAAEAKRKYYERHLGESYRAMHGEDLQVIVCLSRDKALHMVQPGDLLIDDMVHNLKKWEKSGGQGIYYKTTRQVLFFVNKYMTE